MRTIIIIQSLIILLGAYYVYTLRASTLVTPEPELVPVAEMKVAPAVIEGYIPPTENPPRDETETDATTVTGSSDVGMEFPIMDEGVPEAQ